MSASAAPRARNARRTPIAPTSPGRCRPARQCAPRRAWEAFRPRRYATTPKTMASCAGATTRHRVRTPPGPTPTRRASSSRQSRGPLRPMRMLRVPMPAPQRHTSRAHPGTIGSPKCSGATRRSPTPPQPVINGRASARTSAAVPASLPRTRRISIRASTSSGRRATSTTRRPPPSSASTSTSPRKRRRAMSTPGLTPTRRRSRTRSPAPSTRR